MELYLSSVAGCPYGLKMNAISLQVPRTDNRASGLRFALLDVEPFEENKVVKRLGIKYRETVRGLKPTESFADFVRFNTNAVLGSFPMPTRFDQNKVAELIATRRIKDFESDTEFKRILEHMEKLKARTGLGRALSKLVQFLVEKRKATLDDMFQRYAAMFLSSDFPMTLITDFTDFETTYLAALEFIEATVKKHSALIDLPEFRTNFEKHRRAFNKMKFALSPVIEQIDVSYFKEQALHWYLLISNAKDSDSIFEIASLSKARTNEEELKRLQWEFQTESVALRKIIMQASANYFEPLTQESELKSMFGEMVIALTG